MMIAGPPMLFSLRDSDDEGVTWRVGGLVGKEMLHFRVVLGDVTRVQVCCLDAHRAVEEDWDLWQVAVDHEFMQQVENLLRAIDGESRDDDDSSTIDSRADLLTKQHPRFLISVESIAVGRFHKEDIGAGIWLRFMQNRDAIASDIAGKENRLLLSACDFRLQLDRGCTEDVPLPVITESNTWMELVPVIEGRRLEELERGSGVRHSKQRQSRFVF